VLVMTGRVETMLTGPRSRVIVLTGRISGAAVEDLRRQLLAAAESDALEVSLDLRCAQSVSPIVERLVAAASAVLAARGGVVLAWSRVYTARGAHAYVVVDVRDRGVLELMPRAENGTAGGRPHRCEGSDRPGRPRRSQDADSL
jgi:hypothetical protein